MVAACPLCLSQDPTGGLLRRTFPFPVPFGSQPILLLLLGGKTYGLESIAVLFKDLDMNAVHERGGDERSVNLVHGGGSGLELGYLVADIAHGLPRTLGMIWLPLEGWVLGAPGRLAHVPPYVTGPCSIWVLLSRVPESGG